MQNSGLGNAVNPITSLLHPFRLPALLLVTWRGQPGGAPDEPQHDLMGRITPGLLEQMDVPWELLPADQEAALACLARQMQRAKRERRACAIVIPQGRFAPQPATAALPLKPLSPAEVPSRAALLTRAEWLRGLLAQWREDDFVVATTGYTGRELYALADRRQHLYLVGSMGCASSLGLGLALSRPQRRIWVLDGDGAALMRLGALATIGYERPDNLVHLLLDNACHESTGAQATVSPSVDFCQMAAACGYPRVLRWAEPELLSPGELTFVHCPVIPGVAGKLPRPRETPDQIAARFREAL